MGWQTIAHFFGRKLCKKKQADDPADLSSCMVQGTLLCCGQIRALLSGIFIAMLILLRFHGQLLSRLRLGGQFRRRLGLDGQLIRWLRLGARVPAHASTEISSLITLAFLCSQSAQQALLFDGHDIHPLLI